jgi:hypothetical protein
MVGKFSALLQSPHTPLENKNLSLIHLVQIVPLAVHSRQVLSRKTHFLQTPVPSVEAYFSR